jgi:hypothetical protein
MATRGSDTVNPPADPWHGGKTGFGPMIPSEISGKGPVRPHVQQPPGVRDGYHDHPPSDPHEEE